MLKSSRLRHEYYAPHEYYAQQREEAIRKIADQHILIAATEHDRLKEQRRAEMFESIANKRFEELAQLRAAQEGMVQVPKEPNPSSDDGWVLSFAWLKSVKTVLRSTPGWQDCSIDLEEIEAVALAMLAASKEK